MFTKPPRSDRAQHFANGVLTLKSDGISLKVLNMEVKGKYRKSNTPSLEDLVSNFTTKFVNFDLHGVQGFKVLGICIDGFFIRVQQCRKYITSGDLQVVFV